MSIKPENHITNQNIVKSKPKTHLKASVTILTAVILSSCYSDGSETARTYTLDEIFHETPTVTPQPKPDTNTDTKPDDTKPDTNPVSTKESGVQHILIDASLLGKGNLVTTTRDFNIRSEADMDARADLASGGLLGAPVAIKVSGSDDSETKNGYKSHTDTTDVDAGPLGKKDLAYTSVYKDFGDKEMRTGHIDGAAAGLLPVDGVYVEGNATQAASMPSEGTAQYNGSATYRENGKDKDIEYGDSVFTADFIAKALEGTLSFKKAGDIGLSANIEGNEFSGKKGDYNTEGGFYGADAAYLGGIYEGKNAQGTYGATKKGVAGGSDSAPTPTPTPVPGTNPSTPASSKESGVQHILIDAKILGKGNLVTTTRDFNIRSEADMDARADLASGGLLGAPVAITVSGSGDSGTKDGYKAHTDTTEVDAGPLGKKDLAYTSVYKDFGDKEMRTGHINGTAAGLLPVDGVYVEGNATQAAGMPSEGTAQYSGNATYRENGKDKAIEYGSSVFTADFVAKSLDGNLAFANAGKIGLSAKIEGNEFSGSKSGYNTKGGFYGADAAYLGGIYEGNDAQGTFGAKKK